VRVGQVTRLRGDESFVGDRAVRAGDGSAVDEVAIRVVQVDPAGELQAGVGEAFADLGPEAEA
jgi:hypothetical protein